MEIRILKRIDKGKMGVIYKLLHDSLFILTTVMFLWLVFENLMPGIISERLGFMLIIFLIAANILSMRFLNQYLPFREKNKKTTPFLTYGFLGISLVLIYLSLLRADFLLNISLVILIGASGYFIYRIIFEETNT